MLRRAHVVRVDLRRLLPWALAEKLSKLLAGLATIAVGLAGRANHSRSAEDTALRLPLATLPF